MSRLLGLRELENTVPAYLDVYLPLFEELAERCCTKDVRQVDKALFSFGALERGAFLVPRGPAALP